MSFLFHVVLVFVNQSFSFLFRYCFDKQFTLWQTCTDVTEYANRKPPGHERVRYDTIRYGTIRYDTIRYGTVRYDTIRYDTIRYASLQEMVHECQLEADVRSKIIKIGQIYIYFRTEILFHLFFIDNFRFLYLRVLLSLTITKKY